jgi:hypothetical protein
MIEAAKCSPRDGVSASRSSAQRLCENRTFRWVTIPSTKPRELWSFHPYTARSPSRATISSGPSSSNRPDQRRASGRRVTDPVWCRSEAKSVIGWFDHVDDAGAAHREAESTDAPARADCSIVVMKRGNARGAKGVRSLRSGASQLATGGAPILGRRQPSVGGTSRMTRECQVRICERLGVKFPGPPRQPRPPPYRLSA